MIPFVPWFVSKYVEQYISVLERNYKLSTGRNLQQVYPPQQSFQIEKGNHSFLTFAKLLEDETLPVTCKQINRMIEQQNYTNLFINVLGEHLTSLSERVDLVLKTINPNLSLNSNIPLKEKEKEQDSACPNIQPPPEIADFKLKSMKELEKFLTEKFKDMKLTTLHDVVKENPDYKEVISDEINKLGKWTDSPTQRMYYYRRPSPIDTLHEEQEYILNNSYNGKNIYEWNLDAYADRQIYNMIHRMLMYSTICKTNGNTDKNVAKMIVAGFTGQLKGWWDNYPYL